MRIFLTIRRKGFYLVVNDAAVSLQWYRCPVRDNGLFGGLRFLTRRALRRAGCCTVIIRADAVQEEQTGAHGDREKHGYSMTLENTRAKVHTEHCISQTDHKVINHHQIRSAQSHVRNLISMHENKSRYYEFARK